MLDQWAYLNQVEIDFSRPGTPTDNAYIEAFNSRLTLRQPREGASDPDVPSFGSDAIALAGLVENRRQSVSGADGLGILGPCRNVNRGAKS
jgi:transposase InsO family protein